MATEETASAPLNERQQQLWDDLRALHHHLRDKTRERYRRINPFVEDLFEWKERGKYWSGHDNVTIYNSTTVVGDVKIGKDTWIGAGSGMDGMGGLEIGEHCSIGSGVMIMSHDSAKWTVSGGKFPKQYSPIKIGNCVFVANNVVIVRGVTIGDHCIIGAGSVVTRDIPSYSLAVGVPARVIARIRITDEDVEYDYIERGQR